VVAPEVGIELPQIRTSAPTSSTELARLAVLAEDAGFSAAWAMEPHFGTARALDPLVVLSYAAALTARIRLGVAVLVLPTHQPVRLARAAASLDQLSGGRLILGVGVGPAGLPYQAFGGESAERAARTEEYLAAMRQLWTAPEADSHGRFVRFTAVRFEPKPLQDPLPVWFGGSARPALRRAARFGDGWVGAGSSTSAQFAAAANELDELLEETGRESASFRVAKRVYLAIDQADAVIGAWFQSVYGKNAPSLDVVARGSAAAVADALAVPELARADHLILHPIGDERQVDILAEHVLPALRG
jgi:probable F420-dependent oxidoreductase